MPVGSLYRDNGTPRTYSYDFSVSLSSKSYQQTYDIFLRNLLIVERNPVVEFLGKFLNGFKALVRVDESIRERFPVEIESWQYGIGHQMITFRYGANGCKICHNILHICLASQSKVMRITNIQLSHFRHLTRTHWRIDINLQTIFSFELYFEYHHITKSSFSHIQIIILEDSKDMKLYSLAFILFQTKSISAVELVMEGKKNLQESLISRDQLDQNGRLLGGDNKFDGLSKVHIWAYGVGHFINDLAAGCWFNYLFYFLRRVVQTDSASTAILSGQICDGIATPIVGMLSDRFNTRIGQRKPWYIGGLILTFICFLPLFYGYSDMQNPGLQRAYYIIFPGIFNIGWASLQISHMSLVPALTCSRKRRDKLNNLRNSFTFISNLTVLGIGLVIFSIMSDPFLQYKIIAYTSITIGLVFAIFFLVKIDEPKLTQICNQKQEELKLLLQEQKLSDDKLLRGLSEFSSGVGQEQSKGEIVIKKDSKLDWFKMPKFYLFGICYMCVRLYTNLYGTLLSFYLIDVLKMGDNKGGSISFNIALVPMLSYLSSVVFSTQLNKFYDYFGRKKALFLGTAICIVCLSGMVFITVENNWIMYPLSLFIGASQSLVLSTGINFISDVVGAKAKTGAFVFGIYSLLDKFSCGIAIFLIGNADAYTKESAELDDSDVSFIRFSTVLIPGIACLLSSLIVLSYPIEEYGKQAKTKDPLLQKRQKSDIQEQFIS